jgi:hypothetical protein
VKHTKGHLTRGKGLFRKARDNSKRNRAYSGLTWRSASNHGIPITTQGRSRRSRVMLYWGIPEGRTFRRRSWILKKLSDLTSSQSSVRTRKVSVKTLRRIQPPHKQTKWLLAVRSQSCRASDHSHNFCPHWPEKRNDSTSSAIQDA